MRIPFYYLMEQLQEHPELQILSPSNGEIPLSRPKHLSLGHTIEPGRLYVTHADILPEELGSIPASAAVLAAPEPQALLNLLQDLYDHCENMEEALSAAASTGELRELMDEIETVLGIRCWSTGIILPLWPAAAGSFPIPG